MKKITVLILSLFIFPFVVCSQGSEVALDFDDGVSAYVDLGASGISLGGSFTLEAWIYSDQSDGSWHGFMGNQASGSANRAPGLWVYEKDRIHFGFGNGSSWQSGNTNSGSLIENQWNHVALTYEGTELKVFINGVLETTKTGVSGSPVDPLRWIGRVDNYFNGKIDEVRVWSVERSESDLKTYMCQKLTGSETGLEGYWKFDDNSGTTAVDETGNYDGTLTNMDSSTDWVTSGAPVGDASSYLYTGTWSGEVLSLSSVNRGDFEVNTVSGAPDGIHVYRVDEYPNSVSGITNELGANDIYYGVYVVGGTSPTYTTEYDYSSYAAAISAEPNVEMYNREDNEDSTWDLLVSTLDTGANTLTETSNSGLNQEFLIGGVNSVEINGYLGPGGVGNTDGSSGLTAWYFPKNIRNNSNVLPSDGESIATWLDGSGYGKTITNSGTATFESDGASQINGHSIMLGSALDRDFVTNTSIQGKTLIAVNNPDTRNSFESVVGFEGDKGIRRPNTTDDVWQYAGGGDGVNNDTWSTDTGESYINGSTTDTGTHNNEFHIISQVRPSSYTNDFYIGGYYSGRSFTGELSEVIIYSGDLNLAQKIIVDNYLSAKYDIPLVSNDFFNEDDNGDFDFDVAGIGQATDGSNHTDSQGTGIVRINNPRGLTNDEFLFWGRDNQNEIAFETDESVYLERLNTTYRASRRSNPGRIDVTFDLSEMDLSNVPDCENIELIIDDNSDFSSIWRTYELTDIGGGLYQIENINIRNNYYFTLQYKEKIVVDDTQFYNGSGTGNVPDSDDECYKLLVRSTADGSLSLTENAHVREIEIESGGKLVVDTGLYLEVETSIENNGDIRLIGTSQLIQNHTGVDTNSGSGNLYLDQQGTNSSKYRYNYWSSPVSSGAGSYTVSEVMKDGSTATSSSSSPPDINFVSGYDGDHTTSPITISDYWLYKFMNSWSQAGDAGSLNIGEGFTMKGPGAIQNYTFVGTPNNGEYSFDVENSDVFLLGNPYPSALDADAFITYNSLTNSFIDGSIYFWEHNGETSTEGDEGHYKANYQGGYAVRNIGGGVAAVAPSGVDGLGSSSGDIPGQYIAIGQGFFVNAEESGVPAMAQIIIDNSMRAFQVEDGSSSVFFKGEPVKSKKTSNDLTSFRLGFEHTNDNGIDLTRQLLVVFKEGLSIGYDNGYDSGIYDIQAKDVYWKFSETDDAEGAYVITGLDTYDVDLEIPLEIVVDEHGIVSFMELDRNVLKDRAYLYDKLLDIYYGLSNKISLVLDAGIYEDRFYLTFREDSSLSVDGSEVSDVLLVYAGVDKQLYVKTNSLAIVEKVAVYNSVGRLLVNYSSDDMNKEEHLLDLGSLPSSVYIVRVETDQGVVSKKILLD